MPLDELSIFGDGSAIAFLITPKGMIRNPHYKPIHWVQFTSWGQFFLEGIDVRYQSISSTPIWGDNFKPFSEN